MPKLPLLFILLLLTTSAFAIQIKSVTDNATVTAKISSLDVTRIFVQNDRIKSVKGVKGAYTRENDENSGEIYIQPTALYRDKAFTVLIETEQGRHFTLLLNPMAVPSDTLMLAPKGINKKHAQQFEQASDYELTLVNLIRAMTHDKVSDGYVIKKIDSQRTYSIGHMAVLHLKTVYEGVNYQGEIYELTNTQPYPIILDEREFYKKGTSAISLPKLTVAPFSTTKVIRIRVVSHE